MTAAIRIIRHSLDPIRADIRLASPRQVAVFGTNSKADIKLLNAAGHPHPHISGFAGRFAISQNGPFLENLSKNHNLALRPYGESTDIDIAAVINENRSTHRLNDGWWWIRNGKGKTNSGKTRHPTEDQTSWLLIHVRESASHSYTSAHAGSESTTGPLSGAVDNSEQPTLTASQLMTVAMIFAQYLSSPPRLFPRPFTDTELQLSGLTSPSQRRSEIRQIALKAGFDVDASWLSWMLREENLTYDNLWADKEIRRYLNLSATPADQR